MTSLATHSDPDGRLGICPGPHTGSDACGGGLDVFTKLGLSSRSAATAYAYEHGLT